MTDSRAEELQIDGLVNARDLGGLRTRDGRTILSRQVIRSDNPKGMTDQGQVDLSEVGGSRARSSTCAWCWRSRARATRSDTTLRASSTSRCSRSRA